MQKIKESEFTTYKNHRFEPYFTYIKNGQKTIEGRLRKGLYQNIKVGDHIVVCNEDETDKVEVVVKRVKNYDSFAELAMNEDLSRLLPNVNTTNEAVEIYREFYTEGQEKEFGVVAIEIL